MRVTLARPAFEDEAVKPLQARPAFEDEAVQAEGGSGGAAPRVGKGRGGGGERNPTPDSRPEPLTLRQPWVSPATSSSAAR
ncbi:hypothetical protein B9W64_10955 [Streptomyces sp. CS159]|nr:hypothetical protein B9W64_10955 [Streptomyces sp. CS159]